KLDAVLAGIDAARRRFARSTPTDADASPHRSPLLKIDTVVIRGVNDDEIVDLLEYAKSMTAEIRYIEYMDVGGATKWSTDRVVSRAAILEILGGRYGRITPIAEHSSAPAE